MVSQLKPSAMKLCPSKSVMRERGFPHTVHAALATNNLKVTEGFDCANATDLARHLLARLCKESEDCGDGGEVPARPSGEKREGEHRLNTVSDLRI